jgi:hypothetical protein
MAQEPVPEGTTVAQLELVPEETQPLALITPSPPSIRREFNRMDRGQGGDARQKAMVRLQIEHTPSKRRLCTIDESIFTDGAFLGEDMTPVRHSL